MSVARTFQREGSLYLACNDKSAFFTSEEHRGYTLLSSQQVCEALIFLLGRFGTKLCRQIIGISMDTSCAPLAADLFLLCYERDCMMSLSADKNSEIIEALNSRSRCLDNLLNIDNTYFDGMIKQIYTSELQLNKESRLTTLLTSLIARRWFGHSI